MTEKLVGDRLEGRDTARTTGVSAPCHGQSTRQHAAADAEMDADMILVRGGLGLIGSDRFYAEERPVVEAEVGDVWWAPHPVTNAQFAVFVAETGYVTVAERDLDPGDFPGADPELLVAGSQVFTQPPGPVPLHDWTQWWRWQPGAQWRHPHGDEEQESRRWPGPQVEHWSQIADHPVVHVGWEDALAYALWAGQDLPTEAEWEHAARGGLVGASFAWGEELDPGGDVLANTWQGPFPWRSNDRRGHHRTSPVASYPPNGYGLFDMIGNVWEWTRTPWTPDHRDLVAPASPSLLPSSDGRRASSVGAATPVGLGAPPQQDRPVSGSCCGGHQRPVPGEARASVTEQDRMVTKGGSHLCSPHYCRRYRPAARQGQGVRDSTSHVGFRCVTRAG
ncbi:SUMF1/EgtB/PvdO family nonheme iron enzyme [Nocardioides sp. NPDC092400]|uniref:SUMF1/EgtB/PvdO family nonheme iron enzyme n=1 Tax=Nocardioides sp. NPDC092400 TaxID=3155196 RepID=UPI0034258E12